MPICLPVSWQHSYNCLLYGFHLIRRIYFLSVKIPDIKNVDDLIDLRGNFGHPDIEAAPEKCIGYRVIEVPESRR